MENFFGRIEYSSLVPRLSSVHEELLHAVTFVYTGSKVITDNNFLHTEEGLETRLTVIHKKYVYMYKLKQFSVTHN